MTSSQAFCISKSSAQKAAAAAFINYFVNDEDANRILRGERGVSIMGNIRGILEPELTVNEKLVYSFVDAMGLEASHPVILDPPGQQEIIKLNLRLLEQVIFDAITADEAAKQLRSGALEILGKRK
jgi:multiple sugar transport system substrate-binding protein